MVRPAQWDHILVADTPSEGARLGEPQMMRDRWLTLELAQGSQPTLLPGTRGAGGVRKRRGLSDN
jgi:hypothetical protein